MFASYQEKSATWNRCTSYHFLFTPKFSNPDFDRFLNLYVKKKCWEVDDFLGAHIQKNRKVKKFFYFVAKVEKSKIDRLLDFFRFWEMTLRPTITFSIECLWQKVKRIIIGIWNKFPLLSTPSIFNIFPSRKKNIKLHVRKLSGKIRELKSVQFLSFSFYSKVFKSGFWSIFELVC